MDIFKEETYIIKKQMIINVTVPLENLIKMEF